VRALVGHLENIRPLEGSKNLDLVDFVAGKFRKTLITGRHYSNGQNGFYIPVGEEIPDDIAEEMWLKGKLDGPGKNMVGSRVMFGVTSDGLFYGEMGNHWNQLFQDCDVIYSTNENGTSVLLVARSDEDWKG
jgi:hypothetical protein